MARVHWAAIVVGVAICSCAFATEDPQSGKGIGIQEAWILNGKARVNTLPYDGPSIDSLRLAATAAIAHYSSFVQNGLVAQNATCGATFLSPHFAVTAAHCVDGVIDGPWNDPGEFFVDHIDVSSVNTSQVHAQGTVTGSWPDWTAGNSVSPPSGYLRRRTTCRVRCGRTPSFTACTSGTATQDMALIECPDRDPAFEPYWVYAHA